MARQTLYEKLDIKDKLGLVEGWKRDGLTDLQIAENLGVSKNSIIKWKKEKKDFSEAIKKGKEVSDYQLENALHRRATGYYYKEETVTNKGDVVEIEKYEHANPTSLIFALKNRLPAKYRDKVEQEITQRNIDLNIGAYDDDDGDD
ncbi:helix-turn-helix domain-containing protein [Staphylococcus equorum]|uniref:helix-turn-helix domain-containing protein n=1 Tax=Staphylococcus equorum TaxID=246432 RepID=UPI0020CCBFBB|nr:helix-turn-helix domain-containing protein [Staphylococcus equorum]MEB7746277.1 helix-turn-helix domain-containing protein [Staphylococcus equorum]UTT55161.1 helix-turn-helix domain-containing protein [Staphylococcus equorum]UTT55222.1 helix-turn-helix domain-containing protein [Staphylococcus equorum]